MVAEIGDFENGIQKLEKIQKERIRLDTTEIKSLFLAQQEFLKDNKRELEDKRESLQSKLD